MAPPYAPHGKADPKKTQAFLDKAEEREKAADAAVDPELWVVQIRARVYEVSPLGAQAVKHLCHATHFKTSDEAREAMKLCGYSDGTYSVVQAKQLQVLKRAAKKETTK